MRITSLAALVLATSIAAQDAANEPRFRIALAGSAGNFDFSDDFADDDTGAGLFRLQFEFISHSRIGGGIRIETFVSDDDLFASGPGGVEARNGSVFGHFTYRLGSDRFELPVRAGVLASTLTLETNGSGQQDEATSFGPYVELAPEYTLIHVGPTRWTLYGEFGVGYTVTSIDSDTLADEFDTNSLFYGAEVGTRVGLGMFEAGLGYLARFQATDESDAELGVTFPDFDTTFQGIMLSLALRF